MKTILVNQQQNLEFADVDIPEIQASQCLIKVHAIGVNRADLLQRSGHYPPPEGESEILGLEVSGEIVAVGNQVHQFKLGERICGLVAGGGYAEFVAIEADHIIKLPERISFVQGAGIAEVFLTAYQALFSIARLKAEQKVFIHAGASGVGTAAIQLAKSIGCFVAVTTSNQAKANVCNKLGADLVINYKEENIKSVAKAAQPSGFDVIVDVTAGNNINLDIDILALDGKIVVLAILAGRYAERIDIAKLLLKRGSIIASTLRNRSNDYKRQLVANFVQHYYAAFEKGEIFPVIDSIYTWQQADLAHQKMSKNENIGKLILTVE